MSGTIIEVVAKYLFDKDLEPLGLTSLVIFATLQFVYELLNKEPVKRAQDALQRFDKSLKVKVLEKTARTAKDASLALGCEVGAIVKSLLFKAENSLSLKYFTSSTVPVNWPPGRFVISVADAPPRTGIK